jgi:hypothetical protein
VSGFAFLRPSIALQAPPSKGESGDRCMLPPVTSEIEQPVRETVRSKNGTFAKYLISLVGPAGMPLASIFNTLNCQTLLSASIGAKGFLPRLSNLNEVSRVEGGRTR